MLPQFIKLLFLSFSDDIRFQHNFFHRLPTIILGTACYSGIISFLLGVNRLLHATILSLLMRNTRKNIPPVFLSPTIPPKGGHFSNQLPASNRCTIISTGGQSSPWNKGKIPFSLTAVRNYMITSDNAISWESWMNPQLSVVATETVNKNSDQFKQLWNCCRLATLRINPSTSAKPSSAVSSHQQLGVTREQTLVMYHKGINNWVPQNKFIFNIKLIKWHVLGEKSKLNLTWSPKQIFHRNPIHMHAYPVATICVLYHSTANPVRA